MPSDEENTPPAVESNDDERTEDGGPPTDPSEPDPGSGSETDGSDADGEDTAGGDDAGSDSIGDVETIRVDPDDVVRSLAYNGQEDIGPKGKAVFSLTPPFEEPVEPSIRHLDDDSTESKADDEIHIRPFRFVMEGRQVIEQRPTRRLAKAELDAEDPDEAAIEAWIDEAMETWKTHIRENFAESVDIYSPQGMAFVDVEYAESE
jgi:molecular chaperone DnaK (HSP70)